MTLCDPEWPRNKCSVIVSFILNEVKWENQKKGENVISFHLIWTLVKFNNLEEYLTSTDPEWPVIFFPSVSLFELFFHGKIYKKLNISKKSFSNSRKLRNQVIKNLQPRGWCLFKPLKILKFQRFFDALWNLLLGKTCWKDFSVSFSENLFPIWSFESKFIA